MFKRGIFISCPKAVEHVLKTNFENYEKGHDFSSRFMIFLGNGIFNTDGYRWKTQRKTASHMFNARTMRDCIFPAFLKNGKEFVKEITRVSKTAPYIDAQDYYGRYTLDSIGEIAFGNSIDSLHAPENPFARAFDQANEATTYRFVNPFWKLTTYLLPSEYKLRKSCKVLHDFSFQIIKERREFLANGGEANDVLSRFIQMKDDDGKPFSDTYLRDVVLNFILAGRDTTANTFSWLTYYLTQFPEIQNKVIAEIDQVLKGNDPDLESVKDLSYLHCVVHEALRLSPPVPVELKFAVKDDTLPSGHVINKGDIVAFLPFIMNREPEMFSEPEEFRPERWMELSPSPFEFPTFNAGPRMCLGKQMAILEVKTLMAMILQKFRVALKPNHHPVEYELTTVTLPIKNGLHVEFQPRV